VISLILSFIPAKWLALIGSAMALLFGAAWAGWSNARSSAKVDNLEDEVKAHETRNDVETRIDVDTSTAADRLRDKWGR
jgi:uncharacterized membrane protein